jgi:hypothetical protein
VTAKTEGFARSVHVRLVRHAKAQGLDPSLVFTRYATERLLYRLSVSEHRSRFILKGAMLIMAWFGDTIRGTRDADLDGMRFDPSSVAVRPIRDGDPYGGQRVTMLSRLGSGRITVQVDVGLGDAVFPEPEVLELPSLLDAPPARLKAYLPETVVAEKLHALVTLGSANTRLKDFFNLHLLATSRRFQGRLLGEAVVRTFERRNTELPVEVPVGLTPAFVTAEKQAQWARFVERGTLRAHRGLDSVVADLAVFLMPVLDRAVEGATWVPGAG